MKKLIVVLVTIFLSFGVLSCDNLQNLNEDQIQKSVQVKSDGTNLLFKTSADGEWKVLTTLAELGLTESSNAVLEVKVIDDYIQFKNGQGEWTKIVAIADLQGPSGMDGKTPEFRISEDNYFQWKYTTDEIWINLYKLDDLKGPKGDTGATGATGPTGATGKNGIDAVQGIFIAYDEDITISKASTSIPITLSNADIINTDSTYFKSNGTNILTLASSSGKKLYYEVSIFVDGNLSNLDSNEFIQFCISGIQMVPYSKNLKVTYANPSESITFLAQAGTTLNFNLYSSKANLKLKDYYIYVKKICLPN